MTGGTINGSINGEGTPGATGAGPSDEDTIVLEGGTVNGDVSGNLENDSITLSGATVVGAVSGNEGNDAILWSAGFAGAINGNDGTDLATFLNLTPANLTPGVLVDGGLGLNDRLVWNNTSGGVVGRYVNWELFELTNASQLTFSSTLTLGDSGTGTGTLSVDPTSTVFAGNGAHSIEPFDPGQLVAVNNAGTIDLTNGPVLDTDSLRIVGNYVGTTGRILFDTFLRSDGSPSDLLIIDRGNASGSTTLSFTDSGGLGAQTTGDGILVVDAVSGGTTDVGTFTGFAAAGPFEYLLYRGNVDGTLPDNWYLRSELDCDIEGAPTPPCPSPPSPPSPLAAVTTFAPITAVATFSAITAVTAVAAIATVTAITTVTPITPITPITTVTPIATISALTAVAAIATWTAACAALPPGGLTLCGNARHGRHLRPPGAWYSGRAHWPAEGAAG